MDSSKRDFSAHFDHTDPRLTEDPYPVYRELREKCPVAHSDVRGGYWLLSRYKDVFQAAHEYSTFISGGGVTFPPIGNERPMIPIETDPPQQKKYRSILNPAFTLDAVAHHEPYVRSLVTEFIDAFIDKGECDLVRDLAMPLPMFVIAHLLGIPLEDRDKFKQWSIDLAQTSAEDAQVGVQAAQALYGYFAEVLAARRQKPGADLVSLLLAAKIDGRPLTEEELLDMCLLLLVAGNETTTNAIGSTLWYLAQHPQERTKLIETPALIPTAIEEFLRYESPVQGLKRTLTKDVELGGQTVGKGEVALLMWGSANRDEGEFPRADQCILDRHPNRHLAFGTGIHRCLGAHLARLELTVVLEEVLRRMPDYHIPESATVERHSGLTRGFNSLPVLFSPKPRT